MYDIYSLGLALLELVFSDLIKGSYPIRLLCSLIKNFGVEKILDHIVDERLKNFIRLTLNEDASMRPTVDELMSHPFFEKSKEDHSQVQISTDLA